VTYSEDVWDAVKAMWMAGNSASSIGNKQGLPTKQAICDRIKSEGWERIDKPDESLAVIPFDGLSPQQQIVATKIGQGLTQKDAAAFAGITPETVSVWVKNDPNFLKAKQAAVAVKAARRVKRIEDAEDWRAATWLLERDPDSRTDYGPPRAPVPTLPHMMFNVLGQVQVGMDRSPEPQAITVEATPVE